MKFEKLLLLSAKDAESECWDNVFDEIDSATDIRIPDEVDRRIFLFTKKLDKKINKKIKNTKSLVKVLIVAAATILLLSISAFAFPLVRNFITNVYHDCSEIIFNDISKSEDYKYAEYTNIPKGYMLIKNEKSKLGQKLIYEKEGKQISINTSPSKNTSFFIDTENAETGSIKVNNIDGYYSITERALLLVWSTGKYSHCITADNCEDITISILINIAESRKTEKNK